MKRAFKCTIIKKKSLRSILASSHTENEVKNVENMWFKKENEYKIK
jgi:hypothetical protein